jgi:hypothetical protein
MAHDKATPIMRLSLSAKYLIAIDKTAYEKKRLKSKLNCLVNVKLPIVLPY